MTPSRSNRFALSLCLLCCVAVACSSNDSDDEPRANTSQAVSTGDGGKGDAETDAGDPTRCTVDSTNGKAVCHASCGAGGTAKCFANVSDEGACRAYCEGGDSGNYDNKCEINGTQVEPPVTTPPGRCKGQVRCDSTPANAPTHSCK